MSDLTDHRLQELVEAADDYAANHGSEIDHDIAAALRDAERYRWLRGSPLQRGKCFSFDGISLKCGSDLDNAIDAAMKEQRP